MESGGRWQRKSVMMKMTSESGSRSSSGDGNFFGKTVLVTGSTQNLGLTIALAFARQGARVILHGKDHEDLQAAAAQIRKECPEARVTECLFDLADEEATRHALEGLTEQGIAPDILINNAAALGVGTSGFLEQSVEFFREVMEVNVFGLFLCSQWAARAMKSRERGAIINISSLGGERAISGRSAYNASKAAVDGLTRSMAVELAPHGIRVNAIAPGHVWTPRWLQLADGVEARRRANIPWGAPTQQEEIAQLVLFLASDAAPSLIGGNIVIDGGLNAQQVPTDVSL